MMYMRERVDRIVVDVKVIFCKYFGVFVDCLFGIIEDMIKYIFRDIKF